MAYQDRLGTHATKTTHQNGRRCFTSHSNPTRPAIVIVHGGSFVVGRKNDTHLDQMSPTDEARYFAQHGFAAVRI